MPHMYSAPMINRTGSTGPVVPLCFSRELPRACVRELSMRTGTSANYALAGRLHNGSSGCATGHPVIHQGSGWSSVRNILYLIKG